MRKLIYITIMVSFIACKDSFLEVVPLGSQVAVTTDDYDKLMNDPAYYLQSFAGGWQEQTLMEDDIDAEEVYLLQGSQQMLRLFQWQDVIYQQQDQAPWAVTLWLEQLYSLNKIINEVMVSSGGSNEQKRSIRAQALATRAWTYFQFINFYGKPYVESTAGNDPGFPIIEQADVSMTGFTRASVQSVYDFIIKDLNAAIADLPVKPLIQTRMSRPAAEGLLGKVYLYMGRNDDALKTFNAAFTDLAGSDSHLYDYNQTLAPGGAFLPVDMMIGPSQGPGNNQNDLTEAVISKVFYNGPYSGNQLGNNGLVLAPWAAALYGASDLRLQLYTNTNPDLSPNTGGRLRKYGVQYARMGLQLPDLYLLRAECKARLNDLQGAVADIETLRKNRMPAADATIPASIAGNQTALIRFIFDERVREFAAEGYRWFDMRRQSVDPLFAGQVFTHTLHKADGTAATYTLKQPNRLVLQLPPTLVNANPGIPNNP
ncbi:RagB/SusD family nutrient uptake outer membrane protein [Chitinophaga pinensis]|uniref:RagB/SusD domain protein n=1 Tax=Chitinophaga pinensis (strain ATCC 43595 / DSM 2588 / LMG 13176 / NBRC 15968 / NCIMB 11800 / UQM 2034) TaxID=485918 RepID=A0A979G3L2_CHIPD|nr:RagB/SusD family nutrient uptake outer membrane protein [Chitinophaga pinensis]ACU60152.1 RagB/SusD domain protein [Chitinophaga pinensis DSM 2588]